MATLNKYTMPAWMEAKADRQAEEWMRSVEDASEDAWLEAHPEEEPAVEEAMDWLMDEVLSQMEFMRKRMKDAGASDEVLAILDRYAQNMPKILE